MQGRKRKVGGPVVAGFKAGVVAHLFVASWLVCDAAVAQLLIVAIDDAFSVAEDSGNSNLDVLANDFVFGDDDDVVILSATAPAGGQVSIMGRRRDRIRYRPNDDFFGTDTFTYTIGSGEDDDDPATATVTITVTPVPDAPEAGNDTFMAAEDSTGNVLAVLANDVDVDGDPLTIAAVTTPSRGGTVTIAEGGATLLYTPAPGFSGEETFGYTTTDGTAEDSALVTVTVTAVNDAPVAANDAFTVAEGSGATALDVLANDADPEGGALTITAVTAPNRGGSVAIAENGGSLVYTPAAGFDGEERFSYTVQDADGAADSAEVRIAVTNVNAPPVANDDAFTVGEDSGANTFDVLANDTDPDGDALSIASIGTPQGGTAVVASGSARVTYQPRANFAGVDSFTYTVRDASGATDSATVTITVTGVDDPPVAANDSFSVDEDSGSNRLDVLANDTDPDGGTLRVSAVTAPNRGGTATIDNGGSGVSYSPAAEFSGVETFTYTVVDEADTAATATVTVSVTGRDDAPVIEPDPIPDQTAQEAQSFSLDLAQFVSDADSAASTLVYAHAGSTQPPPGLTLSGAGLLSGTPQIGTSVGEHTLRFAVSDGTTTTTSEPFKLTVLRAGRVDLAVSATAAPNPARPSETVTWTFSIANLAPDTAAPNVRLDVDVTGAPFTFDTGTAQGCTVTPASGGSTVACTIATPIAGGGSRDVVLTGRGSQPGDVSASATISIAAATPIDEVESNDTASATLSIAEALAGAAAQRIDGIDARAAAAGDLDGDGHDDLVVATGPAQATLVFFNVVDPANPHKRMLSTTPLALGQPGADNDVAVVDADGDGDLDVVTAAAGGRSNMLYTNDGGVFSGSALPGPAGASAVAAGDFDGDGNVDLVFGKPGADLALRGAGSTFLPGTAFGNGDSRDVVFADLFGNSVPEVVVANADGDAQIYRGAGGGLTLDRTLPTGPTTSVAAGDFDGDGFTDLVFGKEPTGGSPQASNVVFLNGAAAGGGFARAEEIGTAPTVAVASADTDLDGDMDVVFVNRTGAHQVFLNGAAPGGRFAMHPQQVAMPRALSAVAASLGADDRVDLAIVGSGGIAVYYNDGAGNFGLGDTQAPTLRLNGVPDVTLRVGSAYTDAGATALDAEDGDVSSRIEVTNPVDTAVIGTYEVVYEVRDKSGNRAVPLSRTVRVAAAEGQVSGGGGGGAADALFALLVALAALTRLERRPAGARSARAGTPC